MLGKKILAVIFAALVLIKLAFLLIAREQWLGMAQTFRATAPRADGFLPDSPDHHRLFHLYHHAPHRCGRGHVVHRLADGSQPHPLCGLACNLTARDRGRRPGQGLAAVDYLDSHRRGRALPGVCPGGVIKAASWEREPGVSGTLPFSPTRSPNPKCKKNGC